MGEQEWRIEGRRGPGAIISAGVNAEGDGPARYVGVLDPMFHVPGERAQFDDDLRLILAAPAMREALKKLRAAFAMAVAANVDLEGFDPSEHVLIKAADAALRQAEPALPEGEGEAALVESAAAPQAVCPDGQHSAGGEA